MDLKISNINLNDLVSYCIFPNSFIRNGRLTPQQKILFEILCSYDYIGDNGDRKGYCDPTLNTLSKEMGLTVRSVQVHLKRLVEKGLVSIIYRTSCSTGGRSNIYVLNILPGLSRADIARIAKARDIQIKNLISGLNTIRVKTVDGIKDISPEEFDLQFITTGCKSSEVIEGEIMKPEEIISDEEEAKVNSKELSVSEETEMPSYNIVPVELNEDTTQKVKEEVKQKFSFKKIALPPRDKSSKNNISENNAVQRIVNRDFTKIKPIDICKYFKYKYKQEYNEIYFIDRIKDSVAIKTRLKEIEISKLVNLIDFFIEKYKDLFYSDNYKRPKIYMLNISWLMNKLMENYDYSCKQYQKYSSGKIEEGVVEHPVSIKKEDIVGKVVF